MKKTMHWRRMMMGLAFCLVGVPVAVAQMHSPIKWQFNAKSTGMNEAEVRFTANLEDGWHLYSQYIEEGGPLPTTFTFHPGSDYSLVGKVKEDGEPVKSYDNTFMMDIVWFAKTVVFTQKVKLNVPSATIKGKIEFMVCTDEMCLPPEEIPFTLDITAEQPAKKKSKSGAGVPVPQKKDPDKKLLKAATVPVPSPLQSPSPLHSSSPQERGWGEVFLAGLLGGLAAILMPCIFPMLPFTVGYFMKRGGTRRKAVGAAVLYGLSIIVLYVSLGLLTTVIFGSDALNELSTNGIFNFLFFLLLLFFGASFLGAFDLTLPPHWVNKVDALADRRGLPGIFFMAATLALVSFSCTGPIIGTLLVETAVKDGLLLPVVGMFGFSLALALPFTLFAMFPSALKALPKSGGWLNNVKVILGFLELALALKFLSNVDLAYHWEWFDREVFLVLWIIIFGLMGFYLLGKIRLAHDSEVTHLAPLRLMLAIVTLAFTLYMIPGLWGAPLKVIAAFLPPQQTQDFDLYTGSLQGRTFTAEAGHQRRKYDHIFEAPYRLNAFFDYEEGLAYASKVNKPVMIDFTGHACVNCRKMEATVWPAPEVMERLRNDYVLIQLYVDDKTQLPEPGVSAFSGKKISTLGNKWSDLQASVYETNAQPYYVLLDGHGRQLVSATGADYDAANFRRFLDAGLQAFNAQYGDQAF